jgi:hypothetical protein
MLHRRVVSSQNDPIGQCGSRGVTVGSQAMTEQLSNGTHGPQQPPETDAASPGAHTGSTLAQNVCVGSQSIGTPPSTASHGPVLT